MNGAGRAVNLLRAQGGAESFQRLGALLRLEPDEARLARILAHPGILDSPPHKRKSLPVKALAATQSTSNEPHRDVASRHTSASGEALQASPLKEDKPSAITI